MNNLTFSLLNMRVLVLIFLISKTLFFISCSPHKESENGQSVQQFSIPHEKFSESIEFKDIVADFKVIPLESTKASLIGNINHLKLYKDKIYILDKRTTNSVYIFDNKGHFIHAINNIGTGPGEFEKPYSITIDEKNNLLLIYCKALRKILFYSLDGEFIREWKIGIEFKEMQWVVENQIAIFTHHIYNYIDGVGDLPYDLLIIDYDGNILFKQFYNGSEAGISNAVYSLSDYFTKFGDEIYLHWMFNDTVYKINSVSVIPFCYFDFGSKNIDPESFKSNGDIFRSIISGDSWCLNSTPLVTTDNLLFTITAGVASEEAIDYFTVLHSRLHKKNVIFKHLIKESIGIKCNFPIATYFDYFIYYLSPEEIELNLFNNNYMQSIGNDITISEFDNPVLIFVKFDY